jgi:hypothetical protein
MSPIELRIARANEQLKNSAIMKNPNFYPSENTQDWFGIFDEVARGKLETAWQEHWDSEDWKPRRAPKLSAVGPIKKGYAVCRKDKLKNWLY